MSQALRAVSNAGDALRTPPHNYEAERALLGAIFLNNRAMDVVSGFLSPEHFADPVNGRVFEICRTLIDEGQQVNPVTMRTLADADDLIKQVGGVKYLSALAANAITVVNAEDYGRLIADLFQKRQIIDICMNAMNECYDAGVDVAAKDIIETIDGSLTVASDEGMAASVKITSFQEAFSTAIKEWEQYDQNGDQGVKTGLEDVDDVMGSMQPQDLIVLGGRPSMGKSALAMTIAKNAAEAEAKAGGKRMVAFFSLEMSRSQLVSRIVTAETGLISPRRRKTRLREQDWAAILGVGERLADLPLYIDETGAMTLSAMRAVCRRIQRRNGLLMVVVDYLQLMGIERGLRFTNDVEKITYLSSGLKALAKLLNVPVLALSQLSRQVEQREDKHPQLADLRQSGSIEQDADTVLFCYREHYYLSRQTLTRRANETTEHFSSRSVEHTQRILDTENEAEVMVAKARHGDTANVPVFFDGPRMWFGNKARG